ncbi:bifunctional diguanylate cyclase/phosphodiesterase [Deinococcus sp. 6YEL10]|uniref:putative bifunctional diguanylate cyclase/phosphodiesterase n=1 Tax=Deinococcus sp. 6YEL10 TaxID=2745870 RepID=UPI001E386AED|nr:bifunctional diguanylate cyclase/phosphodiesterase [Deinococcus sp. 6YEL10]MCD0161344.1 bifunctional diguanylate cyclase/phosphodiesterase [Deinococcus sp. 6YEL10]
MRRTDPSPAAPLPETWRLSMLVILPVLVLFVGTLQVFSRHDLWDRTYDLPLNLMLLTLLSGIWLATARRWATQTTLALTLLLSCAAFLTVKLALLAAVVHEPAVLVPELIETMVWLPTLFLWRLVADTPRSMINVLNALLAGVATLSGVILLAPLLRGEPLQPDVIRALLHLNLSAAVTLHLTSLFMRRHEDLGQRRGEQNALRALSSTDLLTGLPGRTRLQEDLRRMTQPGSASFALLHVDVDGFKIVNATLGHPAGDTLLCILARELERLSGPDAQVYRLSGDEFVVLLPGVTPEQADWTGQTLLHEAAIEPSAQVGVETTLSIGLTLYPHDSSDPDELLRHADSALFAVKRAGRRRLRRYHPEQDALTERSQLLARELGGALPRQELTLVFQPVYRLADHRIVKAEALLRWTHPTLGRVSPAEFIPVAERSGLITPIGTWVLNEACRAALAWPDLTISVNVSAVQLLQFEFRATVQAALTRSGLPPARLELELTETAVLYEDARTARTLHELREMGVQISIDDFGSGYSNLMRLRTLPITGVKLDRSITADLTDPAAAQFAQALTQAVTGIARNLGADVTAEGIETPAHLSAVRTLRCQLGQGYGLALPMNGSELTERLLQQPAQPAETPQPGRLIH